MSGTCTRTETVQQRPPVVGTSRRIDGQTTGCPAQFEDQIRGYRTRQRRLYEAQRAVRRIIPAACSSNQFSNALESRVDLNTELELSARRRAMLAPTVLYTTHGSDPQHRVYQHYSEERVLVVNEGRDMRFIQEDSYDRLRREGFQHIHMGMMMVHIATLHRRDTGVMALIIFRDTRWTGDLAIIGTMEADLSRGPQIVYITPDIMTSIHDFYNHIQVTVMTCGYGD